MGIAQELQPDFGYYRRLVTAGVDGIASARRDAGGRVLDPPLQNVVWMPAAIGVALGVGSAWFVKRRSGPTAFLGGVLGGMLGCGAALAWASRAFVGPATRSAVRQVTGARDEHWLAAHPIDYA